VFLIRLLAAQKNAAVLGTQSMSQAESERHEAYHFPSLFQLSAASGSRNEAHARQWPQAEKWLQARCEKQQRTAAATPGKLFFSLECFANLSD